MRIGALVDMKAPTGEAISLRHSITSGVSHGFAAALLLEANQKPRCTPSPTPLMQRVRCAWGSSSDGRAQQSHC